jgi:uncharacterized membrane protein
MFGYDWPRLHAALNDLPTALLLTAVLFDVLALATGRETFRRVSFWTLIVGAVGGAAAVISGLQAEDHIAHGEAVHQVMETHETLALITLGVFGVLALWRLIRDRRMGTGERSLGVIASVAGLGVLVATAVYGGRLVFEHAAGIPTPVLQEEMHERSEGHHHNEGDEHESSSTDAGHVDPPGTPPHSHSPSHVDPPGTPPHSHPPDTTPHEH